MLLLRTLNVDLVGSLGDYQRSALQRALLTYLKYKSSN